MSTVAWVLALFGLLAALCTFALFADMMVLEEDE